MTRTPARAALPETCHSEPHNLLSNLSSLTQQVNDAAAIHIARHKLARQAGRTSMTARTASSQSPKSSDDPGDPLPPTATRAHGTHKRSALSHSCSQSRHNPLHGGASRVNTPLACMKASMPLQQKKERSTQARNSRLPDTLGRSQRAKQ